MEHELGYPAAISSLAKRKMSAGIDAALRSLVLLERSRRVRQMVDLCLTGIEVEPMPPCLGEGHRAILVSNYPSIASTLRAVMKVTCRLPGQKTRLKAIARPEVVAQANPVLKALGIERLVFPVEKNDAGAYRLERKVLSEVLAYLDGPGHVLWLSITGRTRGNGLLEEDRRTGAAQFAVKKRVPVVPMGLVTRERNGKLQVVKVRFGEPINPPEEEREIGEFEKADFLIDFSRLAMCQIASLLPPGQRGDFENVDEKLAEARQCLGAYQF